MNLNLQYNSVGFYQLSKLVCIPFTLSVQYVFYDIRVSKAVQINITLNNQIIEEDVNSKVLAWFWDSFWAFFNPGEVTFDNYRQNEAEKRVKLNKQNKTHTKR